MAAVCLLLLWSLPLSAQEAEENNEIGAKAYIEEVTFDFGFIPGGATVTHAFVVYSRGADSLKILKVRPG
jgi:hypothetical protein